jgi:hypothetical protein
LVDSQRRIAADSAVGDRQRSAVENATAKPGASLRAGVTPAGKISTDRAATDYRIARVVNSASKAAN